MKPLRSLQRVNTSWSGKACFFVVWQTAHASHSSEPGWELTWFIWSTLICQPKSHSCYREEHPKLSQAQRVQCVYSNLILMVGNRHCGRTWVYRRSVNHHWDVFLTLYFRNKLCDHDHLLTHSTAQLQRILELKCRLLLQHGCVLLLYQTCVLALIILVRVSVQVHDCTRAYSSNYPISQSRLSSDIRMRTRGCRSGADEHQSSIYCV